MIVNVLVLLKFFVYHELLFECFLYMCFAFIILLYNSFLLFLLIELSFHTPAFPAAVRNFPSVGQKKNLNLTYLKNQGLLNALVELTL